MQKVPHLEGLSSNYSKLFRVVYKGSLADAEMAEDVVESFLGGDLTAGDVGEMVEGEAEVFGEEVTGEVGVEAFEDTEEGSVGA